MRVIFLGTPSFAVPTLKALIDSKHEIIAVISQPDKPKGRKQELEHTPVKVVAKENGLNVLQYKKIRADAVNDLTHLNPDVMITCAYGQIISKEIIDIPKYGIINLHGSLLPKYRGAAPIQWSIINGETKTGITLMKTDVGIDTGDMFYKKELDINENETSSELSDRLSELAASMVLDGLELLESGNAVFVKQNADEASHFPMLNKSMAKIDFNLCSYEVHNFCRGLNPWPIAYTYLNGQMLKVYETKLVDKKADSSVGRVSCANKTDGIVVNCKDKQIALLKVQVPGGRVLSVSDFLNGNKVGCDTILGNKEEV